jgi:tetratricopeptide (TPR) repeat protein
MDPQPPSAPPPWPPPPPTPPRLDAGADGWALVPAARLPEPAPGRRWPVAGLVIAVLLVAMAGVALGASGSTAAAASKAAQLEAAGDFAAAIAVDQVIEGRTGPLFILDGPAAATASKDEEQTLLAWAKALGREGRVDEAVVLYRSVSDPSLRPRAIAALASLLYTSSMSDAAHAAYPAAIARLEQIIALAPGTAAASQARAQLPIDQAGEARVLIASGHAADAVTLLDEVVDEGSAVATRTAESLYPAALLIAGQGEITQRSYKEAVVALQRLVAKYPGTAQALQAQAILAAPVAVSGTLVARSGAPESGPVRLSTNYKAEPGGTYKTSGPFILSTADSSGDFTFRSVPVGGPYVLEFFADGNWTTLIDPTNGEPSHPVKVTPLVPVDLTFVVLPPSS